jgi:hypothetical protein
MSPGRYIVALLATCLAILTAAVAANVLVDPYGVSHVLDWQRINGERPAQSAHARMHKPLKLWRTRYDGIVLGTSQVEQGFDTRHPALIARGLSLYNGGVSEGRVFEQALLLRHASEVAKIKFAIVALDFLRYAEGGGRPAFMPRDWTRWRAVADYLVSLVSIDGLRDSYSTVVASWRRVPTFQYFPDGTLNVERHFAAVGWPDYAALFDTVDAAYLNGAYDPILTRRSAFEQRGFDHSSLKDMLATARRAGIQLSIFVPPSHARQAEVIRYLGLQPLFDQWLRELVDVVADDAGGHGHISVAKIWDFSGYNAVTTEMVPPPGSKVRMLWYQDSVHFSYRTGRAIMDQVLQIPEPELFDPERFGVELSPEALDDHLSRREQQRAAYVTAHPEVVSNLSRLHRSKR